MNPDPSELELRECTNCHCAVNNFEWKMCRKQACPHSFANLRPALHRTVPPVEPVIALEGVPSTFLTKPVQRRFIKQGGTRCPYCQHGVEFLSEIETVNDLVATRDMRCKGPIPHLWCEVYLLTSVMSPETHDAMFKQNLSTQQPT